MDLRQVTLEAMKPLEGKTFSVSLPDGSTTDMTLEQVAEHQVRPVRRTRGTPPPVPNRTPFSLYFVGSPDLILPQGAYDFRTGDVTIPTLFIVPLGRDETGTEYEAVFT